MKEHVKNVGAREMKLKRGILWYPGRISHSPEWRSEQRLFSGTGEKLERTDRVPAHPKSKTESSGHCVASI